eukprot:TRINITY_DN906_c0_g1_i1.p1 TRINITY_DN906_c0_g1~~TRINITY_DN906_c0_g1_i1.p1  ORF type:complete len:391 (+),score=132.94 TRINITY_DN906_c0_g1_i1:77-1174(+)
MGCLRCCGVLALLAAVAAGLTPLVLSVLFNWLDDRPGWERVKGIAPASHRGRPFGFTFEQIPDLSGKVAVVTGANVGLGYWTALHLARRGARTVLACRSAERCESAARRIRANHSAAVAVPMVLDLGSLASVRAFADKFRKEFDRLDTLVLNAGVMGPPFTLTADGIESQFGVNHVGHQALTMQLLPALQKSAPSTVVAVSSNAHWAPYPAGILDAAQINDEAAYSRADAYGQSKLANLYFAQELAERVRDKGVYVNAIHPGAVETELGRNIEDLVRNTFGQGGVDFIQPLVDLIYSSIWNAEVASLTQLYAAVSPEIVGQNISGKYFHPIARLTEPAAPARDRAAQRRCWEMTEELIRNPPRKA